MSKVVVFGGSGLLGRAVCQEAAARGHRVVSASSRGQQWTQNSSIQHIQADVFDPESYRTELDDAQIVVCSIGILLEANYKPLVNSRSLGDLWTNVQNIARGANPMAKQQHNAYTYERMNRDSALVLAKTLIEQQGQKGQQQGQTEQKQEQKDRTRPTFVFISADRLFPGIPRGYIDSKREAEQSLLHNSELLRPIIMRPGMMYDVHQSQGIRNCIRNATSSVVPQNAVDSVARAIFERAANESFEGVVTSSEISQY